MAKPKKINPNQRISKIPVNSKWFSNVAKSFQLTSLDMIKTLTPNTTDFLDYNASDTMDLVREMRTNVGSRTNVNRQISNIPQIALGKEALKNVLEDIKTGNLNNVERERKFDDDEMDFGFGDLFDESDNLSFGDETGGAEVTVNQYKTNNVLDSLPLAKAMAANTEATVASINTIAEQNLAIESEKLMFNHKAANSVLGGLNAINDNLATLVKFHGDSTTKFYASSIKYYEESLEQLKNMQKTASSSQDKKDGGVPSSFGDDLFSYTGGVKLDSYAKVIKENLKAIKDENAYLSSMADALTSPDALRGLAKNPIGTLAKFGMSAIVPVATKASIQAIDASISSVIPAVMAKINSMEDHDNPIFNYIYKVLGSKAKLSYSVDLGEYEKGAVAWDGQDKKTLNEVIPAYLRRMEAALTGQHERVFDYKSGTFTNSRDLKKKYDERLSDVESTGFVEARTKMREIARAMNANAEAMQQFEADMKEYFSAITKKGAMISPYIVKDSDGFDVDELMESGLFDSDDRRVELMRKALKGLSSKEFSNMAGTGIYDSRKATQAYMDEIRKNPALSGHSTLFNGGMYVDGKLTYDPTKGGGAKDAYGLGSNDYLRDIRSILAQGIAVYAPSKNPHVRSLRRYSAERTTNAIDSGTDDFGSIYNRPDQLSLDQLLTLSDEDVKKAYKSVKESPGKDNKISAKLGSKVGRANSYMDVVTSIIDNRVIRILFGNNADIEDGYLADKNKLKNMISEDKQGRTMGSLLGTTVGFFQDTIKGVGAYFTGQGYTRSDGTKVAPSNDSILGKMKSFFSGSTEKLIGKRGDDKDLGLIGKVSRDFMDGFDIFKTTLFGDKKFGDEAKKTTINELTSKVKDRLPKAIGAGLVGAGVKTALASQMGILGSVLLPGGPIGAAITGTALGFLGQSETFKNWAFGEKNPEGQRMGGFVPKSLVDMINKNGGSIKKDAKIGAGLGVLSSFFLPGGPIVGAVMGVGTSILTKADVFQEMLYGKDFKKKDKKSLMDGAFGKAFKSTIGKSAKDANPKLAAFLGGAGMAAGVAQGIGLLPSFLLPGGPIVGAMLGLAGGITASSDKFQQFLFGDKDIDGKRYGGLMTKFTNWFDTTVVTPFKIKASEINDNIYEFVRGKIVNPFLHAFDPLTQAFKFVMDDAKDAMKKTWLRISDRVIGGFNDHVIQPFGEKLEKVVVNPLKKFFNGTLRILGKTLGVIVSSPFKLLTGLGNMADSFNARHVMRDERRNRRNEFKEMINNKRADGTLGMKDILGGVRRQFIFGKERSEILDEALPYRRERANNNQKRKDDLEAVMAERRARTEEMRKQYAEDREFGKSHNWKYASKKQKAEREEELKRKNAWYQEQIAVKTNETAEKVSAIEKVIKETPKHEKDKLDALHSIKNYLYRTMDNLGELKKNSAKDMLNNIGDKLKEKGQSHADGLDKVPKDGYIAELHEGEMVVPKKGAGILRGLFGAGAGNEKNSIVSTITDKLFGNKDEKQGGILGGVFGNVFKRNKSDRADNALGLSREEQAQMKEMLDMERYAQASRKNVDFIQGQMEAKKKEKEEKKFRDDLLAAINMGTAKTEEGNSFWKDMFSKDGLLGGILSKVGGFARTLLSKLGLGGALGVGGALSALNFMNDKKKKSEESGFSFAETLYGAGDEGQKNAEGLYARDNTMDSIIRNGVKASPTVYNKVLKPTAQGARTGYNAAKKGVKNAYQKFDDFANPKLKITGKSFLGESYEYTSNLERKGLQKPIGAVADFGKTVKKKSGQTVSMLLDLARKAITSLEGMVAKKFPSVKGLSGKVTGIFKSMAKDADTIVKRFGTKITLFFADGAADFIPVVGQVAEAAMTVWDAATGLTAGNAGNLFRVPKDDVDFTMRAITSVMQAACKFSWFSVIWMINEICSSMYDFSFLTEIAQTIYTMIPLDSAKKLDMSNDIKGDINKQSIDEVIAAAMGPDADPKVVKELAGKDISKMSAKDLKKYGISATEKQEIMRKQYNDKNKTKMDKQGFADETSKTVGQKILGSKFVKNIKGTFSKSSARGHLGLNKDAEMSFKERKGFAMAKTGINVTNFFRKMFGKEEIDDKEWFQAKRYTEDGKLSLTGKGTLSYAEAREKKEREKEAKAQAKIDARMKKKPKTAIGNWWNNMMMGIEKGKRSRARKRIGTSEEEKKKKQSKKKKSSKKESTNTDSFTYENLNAANQSDKDLDSTLRSAAAYNALGLTGSAGKGEDEVKRTVKKKTAKPNKKLKAKDSQTARIDKSGNDAVKRVDSMFTSLNKSVGSTANKLTKGLSTGQKTLTSAFTKLQKALISSGKVTSSRLHKATRAGEKDLDKMSKNLVKDAKKLFSTLKEKVDKTLKGIKHIKITTAATVSPTFTVEDPKKFLSDLFGDITKKMEQHKDKKKHNNAGSSGIAPSLSQKANNESGKFIAPTNNTTTNNSTSNKFVFYSQNDSQWSNKKLVGDKTIAQAGCGPTSIAMAVSQMTGEEITPDVIAKLGKRDLPGYSTYNLFPQIAKKFAMNYEDTESEEDIIRYLKDGIPVMLSGESVGDGSSPYTTDGHVVVANSIKGDDVFVSDPRGKNYSRTYKVSELLNGMKKAMVMKPTQQTKNRLGTSKGSLSGIDGQFVGSLNTELVRPRLDMKDLKRNMGASGQIKLYEKVLAYAKAFEKKLTYSQPAREGINNNKLTADCSSFTHHVYDRAAGIEIGGNSRAQASAGQSVPLNQAQAGDLVVFDGHVGIVMDSKNMIDIGSGTGPVIRPFINSWAKNPRIRRVLTDPNQMVSNSIPNANGALGITSVDGLNLGNVASGTTGGETQGETPDMFGAFGSMNKLGQNMVASIFNGKQVDMFGSSGGSTSTTAGTATLNGKTVKALFTSYYPENSALQGGFLDAQGNKLDPSKKTCAAPKEIPFGTKIQIQGTGTEKDGQIYTVNDRGGAIKVRGDEYQFDLLSPNHDVAYAWGRKRGTAVIETPSGSAGKDPGSDAGSSGIPDSMNGWAYFKQGDSRWNTENIGGSTVGRAGCGPTSHSMMLTTMFGQKINPDVMTKYALKKGVWSSAGMAWSMPDQIAKDFKLTKTGEWSGKSDASLQGIKNAIKSGSPVIMSGQGVSKSTDSPFTSGGHIVLGVGVDGNNNIIINDPRDPQYTKSYTDEDMRRGVAGLRHAWALSKTSSSAIPSDIQTDGSFTPGSGASSSGGSSEGSSPELFGVFDSMNKLGQNMVASIFNGKQVDLFGSSGGSTGGSVDVSGMSDTKQAVWKFFTGMGYTPEATAGIMGNLQQESTINPTLIQGNGRGPAAGIAQWENYNSKSARWKQMADHAQSKGKDWTDLQSQLEFIDMELQGSGPVDKYTSQLLSRKYGGYNALKSATDIGKATESFEGSFERAGVKVMEKRKKYAQDIYNQFTGSAGKGEGDGKVHLIQPAVKKGAKPVTKVSRTFAGVMEPAGKGEGTISRIKKAQQDVLRTVGNSYKFNNKVNAGYTGSQQALTSACVDMMAQIVAELAAIRDNTGITAENTKEIKIASANEPINGNQKSRQSNNNTAKRVKTNDDPGYGLARDIAAFK